MPKWVRPKAPIGLAALAPRRVAASGCAASCHFNPTRGVGYISVPERDGDVWFMAQAFERTGLRSIEPGTEVRSLAHCRLQAERAAYRTGRCAWGRAGRFPFRAVARMRRGRLVGWLT